jgi:hypothetical protein
VDSVFSFTYQYYFWVPFWGLILLLAGFKKQWAYPFLIYGVYETGLRVLNIDPRLRLDLCFWYPPLILGAVFTLAIGLKKKRALFAVSGLGLIVLGFVSDPTRSAARLDYAAFDALPTSDVTKLCQGSVIERRAAWKGLASRGPLNLDRLATIMECSLETDPELRSERLRVLSAIGSPQSLILPAIAEGLKDASVSVRITAAKELRKFYENAAASLPVLRKQLAEHPLFEDMYYEDAISKFTTNYHPLVERLTEILKNSWQERMTNAALSSAISQPGFAPVDIHLDERAATSNAIYALEILGRIGKLAVLAKPEVLRYLRHPDYRVRLMSLRALHEMGWREPYSDSNAEVQQYAATLQKL